MDIMDLRQSLNHPLFGVGMNEWERPSGWDQALTISGFSLQSTTACRRCFFCCWLFFDLLGVSFKKGLDDKIIAYRTGFLIAMTAFFLVGWTVHFWDSAYVLFLFLMGSGVWMLDVETKERTVLRAKGVRGGP